VPGDRNPVTDAERQRVLDLITADPTRSAGSIAREVGRSHQTVQRIGAAAGHSWDRSATKNATQARQADNAARRAAVSARFLDKANELLDQMEGPFLAFNFGGRDNTYNEHELERPPTGDLRNLMVAAATAFDKHLAAERHESGDPDVSVVVDLRESMRRVHQALQQGPVGESLPPA
jgi:hypothetical protein